MIKIENMHVGFTINVIQTAKYRKNMHIWNYVCFCMERHVQLMWYWRSNIKIICASNSILWVIPELPITPDSVTMATTSLPSHTIAMTTTTTTSQLVTFIFLSTASPPLLATMKLHILHPWITSPLVSPLQPPTNSHSEVLNFITKLLWFVRNIILYS